MAVREVSMAREAAEKPLSRLIYERRATPHFEAKPVPEQDLKKVLEAGRQSPSGYNLQPWRFIVVRDPEMRQRLQQAAMGQPKVGEAPVVVVACGDTEGWKKGDLEEMLRLGNEHGFPESGNEGARQAVTTLLSGKGGTAAGINGDINIWVNRHVTIAFATMMWMAEALGYDTAPMEGFWEDKVKDVLGIPASVRVVAMLAIGHLKGPDKPYGGRFPLSRLAFADKWGEPIQL